MPVSPPAVSRLPSLPADTGHRRGVRRWLVVLAAVAALHWIAAQWFERHHESFRPPPAQEVPVQIALLKPERIERQPVGPKPAADTAARRAPQPAAAAQPPREHVLTAIRPDEHAAAVASASTSVPASAAAASSAPASAAATAVGASGGTGTRAGNAARTGGGKAAQAAPGIKFSVPPSGDLSYDTFYNGVRNQPGTIRWHSDGQHYEMVVAIPLPFVGTFSWTSEGHVDAFGLAPDQYREQRVRRAPDVTIFNRETHQIAFTRTPASLALPDGAQDRFSMVMQLASLVRGDPAAYKPGVTREFYVADNDSGESWPIETVGDESIRTPNGVIEARHFTRLPRRPGDRRRIDVWLAPALGWLPARLVQTEPNGTQVELVWRGKIEAPQGGEPAPSGAGEAPAAPPSTPAAPATEDAPPSPAAGPASAASGGPPQALPAAPVSSPDSAAPPAPAGPNASPAAASPAAPVSNEPASVQPAVPAQPLAVQPPAAPAPASDVPAPTAPSSPASAPEAAH